MNPDPLTDLINFLSQPRFATAVFWLLLIGCIEGFGR